MKNQLITTIITGLTLTGCTLFDTPSKDPEKASAVLHTNPADATFITLQEKDQEIIVSGTKDEQGYPLRVEKIKHTNADETVEHLILSENAIQSFVDGNSFIIEQADDGTFSMIISITEEDGTKNQIVVNNISTDEINPADLDPVPTSLNVNPRDGQELAIFTGPLTDPWMAPMPNAEAEHRYSDIDLFECNQPLDGTKVAATVKVTLQNGETVNYDSWYKSSLQTFRSVYPVTPSQLTAEHGPDLCDAVSNSVDDACLLNNTFGYEHITSICGTATALGTPAAGATCVSALSSYKMVCDINSGGSSLAEAPTLSASVCEAVTDYADNYLTETQIKSFQPIAVHRQTNERLEGEITLFDGTTFPDFSLTFDGELSLSDFFIMPSDPLPGESYTATFDVGCVTDPLDVVITVKGTDGYEQSVAAYVTFDQALTISVPGAEEGVNDSLKVVINGEEVLNGSITF